MIIDRTVRLIINWPWSSFLVPVWAVATIFRSLIMIFFPHQYHNVDDFNVMFDLAPIWVWAIAGLIVSLGVLVRSKSGIWQILQAALTLMSGVAILFASFGSETVSPTAGVTYLAIAAALWLAMVRNLGHISTPYDNMYKEKREDDQ